MKLAFAVQRYGQAINGGAELHARYIAERLARHAEIEVLTTCASDYVTWRNEWPAGVESLNGVTVRRFPVTHERDPIAFGRLSEQVFGQVHSIKDELHWLDAEGPHSPALIDYLTRQESQYDFCIAFSYRYYHAYHAVRAVPGKAILVPTAERDPAVGLGIFGPMFRGARGLMYNSPEERAMIQAVGRNHDVPSVVVGVGSELPEQPQPQRFRQKFDVRGPFAIYVGRIDANKGCQELFDYFATYVREGQGRLSLVLVGHPILAVPEHPRIRHLGFLDDADKFDAIATADLLLMPSYFESLSMVALEAWGLGRPVVANGHCDVLRGQCVRSNAGLYYENRQEFVETLRALERTKWLNVTLGANGRRFYREHYDWPVIIRKYLDMIERLKDSPTHGDIEALPGWRERRQPNCRPASEVLAAVPTGPSLDGEPRSSQPTATAQPDRTATVTQPAPTDTRLERGSARARRHDPRRARPRNGRRQGA